MAPADGGGKFAQVVPLLPGWGQVGVTKEPNKGKSAPGPVSHNRLALYAGAALRSGAGCRLGCDVLVRGATGRSGVRGPDELGEHVGKSLRSSSRPSW